MTRLLKPGDRIDCHVKSSTIVGPYKSYDEIKTFEIVAVDSYECGYYLYVPHYFLLKETTVVTSYSCKTLGINKKFLNENIVYIPENMVANIQERLDGIACCKCKDFYPFAASNQENGTLICFSCRQNPYH